VRARAVPSVGESVVIIFLASRIGGIVERVDADLRGLEVVTDEGEVLRFALSRVTGRFLSDGQQWGARLFFEDEHAI
jgi:hypothetical protein